MLTIRMLRVLPAAFMSFGLLACSAGEPRSSSESAPSSEQESPSSLVAQAPQVGDCWLPQELSGPLLLQRGGSEPVDCTDRHTAITYAVGSFPDNAAYPRANVDVGTWPMEVWEQLVTVCDVTAMQEKLALWHYSRIQPVIYLPSRSEWQDGQRWLRCDVMVRSIGTKQASLDPGAFDELPAAFEDLASAPKKSFSMCVSNEEDPNRRLIVDCKQSGVRRVVREVRIPVNLTKPADEDGVIIDLGTAAVSDLADSECGQYAGESAQSLFAVDKLSWSFGLNWLTCSGVE